MANVTDLQTKYSKLAQEYSKVKTFTLQNKVLIHGVKALHKHRTPFSFTISVTSHHIYY